jgi:hydrogenase maturation protein HypF
MITLQALKIHVKGVVQGVGFRPFVYQQALKNGLTGWVCNTSGDVTILVEGKAPDLEQFLFSLRNHPPSHSHIENISISSTTPEHLTGFEILESRVQAKEYQLISPDLATCPACLGDIFNPDNRRFHYPFTNCTNCGPRFTIIEDIPYDRPRTTMRRFRMCPACQREYDNPSDRRFHAQPNACDVCGPHLELTDSRGKLLSGTNVVTEAAHLIHHGKILAIKGLGGFLLACDATQDSAVKCLRDRKHRPAKPFAVMLKDLTEVRRYCLLEDDEAPVLGSAAAPIVLLKKSVNEAQLSSNLKTPPISSNVAPGLHHLGVMLPYTPLHHLLMQEIGLPLVMTSGNFTEEPIAKDNSEAINRLGNIADFFILHNRDIYARYDDSVVTVEQGHFCMVRRARGYAPSPLRLPFQLRPVLACGSELKNTFCLTRDNYAFVSQHVGDIENVETLEHFESTITEYQRLFCIQPEMIACDMHPDYLPTRWAQRESERRRLPLIPVQHHHAHIVSCMAENGIQDTIIGVALDGTGYGSDGQIWGSEFITADYRGFHRLAHLEYLPLPGGTAAIRKPYRTAIGYIYALLGEKALRPDLPCLHEVDETEIELVKKQIDRHWNTPLTSSYGRLFDAVSSLLGIRQKVEYEGQAAIELEAAAVEDRPGEIYGFDIDIENGVKIIKINNLIAAILAELARGTPIGTISTRFHNTSASLIIKICSQLAEETGLRRVALSGGVFQNRRLFSRVVSGLKAVGLTPLFHSQLPCNDGGISLGQAVIASHSRQEIDN